MMTSAQVVQMCVTINDSPIQDYAHPDDHEKNILKTLGGRKRIVLTCTIFIIIL